MKVLMLLLILTFAVGTQTLQVQQNVGWNLARIWQRDFVVYDQYQYFNTGRGVDVYVVDTGVLTTAADFEGRAREPFSVCKGKGCSVLQCNQHGTNVAGIIGGNLTGVAKKVNLISVRVQNCTDPVLVSDIVKGLDFVIRDHKPGKPAVVNMSLSGGYSQQLNAKVQEVIDDGITVVVASGNDGWDACRNSPASVPDAITVSGEEGDKDYGFNYGATSFTGYNYGQCVDIFAPAIGNTVWYDRAGNISYGFFGGSSASTPHVTGAVALYLERNPSATPAEVQSALIDNATTGVLEVQGVGSPNRLVYTLF